MRFKLELKNLGRSKVNRELILIAFCPEELEDKIITKAKKYLMSNDVYLEITWIHCGCQGNICAGFRNVGEFKLREIT